MQCNILVLVLQAYGFSVRFFSNNQMDIKGPDSHYHVVVFQEPFFIFVSNFFFFWGGETLFLKNLETNLQTLFLHFSFPTSLLLAVQFCFFTFEIHIYLQIGSHPNIYVMDTPSILPPQILDTEVCCKLALTGSIMPASFFLCYIRAQFFPFFHGCE